MNEFDPDMNTVSNVALMPMRSASDYDQEATEGALEENMQPVVQGLAGHVRSRWDDAKDAKRDLEERMLKCVRQRAGEYDPSKLSQIRRQGGSEIFVQLTSVKCRAATSWLRDTLLGTGHDKPWSLSPTPEPEVAPQAIQQLQQQITDQIMEQIAMTGEQPTPEQIQQVTAGMRDQFERLVMDEARTKVERMERRMEDQLVEGGFVKALNEFLDDVATFPYAVLKGPVKRKRQTLQWSGGELVPTEIIRNEWERTDPFMLYWAPWASDINDGFVIERHKLTRQALEALIGVEGYSEASIRKVLMDFNTGNLSEWLWLDYEQANSEGKDVWETTQNEDLIDALQLWDAVPGQLLIDWGIEVDEDTEIDPHLSYPCEVWLIGTTVIKAVLNYDPLGRKPYYVTCYEALPGRVDGHGVADLARDTQQMINAAARAISNNMGISSGPQVGVNVSRLPAGEDLTQMYPWKLWQFTNNDFNDGTQPLEFFQPQSNAQELMNVFQYFSDRADEDTMIPKYMVGGHQAGASRTSSGLSMLISNAGKGIKQVINNIDTDIIVPVIERLYQDNLRYSEDPEMVGDIKVVAKGAASLVVKEMEAARKMEFLQIVLNSPMAQQIVGMPGAAELLRDMAENFDINTDKLVPDEGQISTMQQMQQMIQQLQMQLAEVTGQQPQQPSGQASQPRVDVPDRFGDGSTPGQASNQGPMI